MGKHRLGVGVVAAVLLLAQGGAPAQPVEVGGLTVQLPCEAKTKLKKGKLVATCGEYAFVAEVGAFTADAYVAKLLAKVPEDQRQVKDISSEGRHMLFVIYSQKKAIAAAVVVDGAAGGSSLALVMIMPAAKVKDGTPIFHQLVGQTLAGLASGGGEDQYGSAGTPAAPAKKKKSKDGRVGFKLEWVQPLDVSPDQSYFFFSRDRFGNLMMAISATQSLYKLAREIFVFEGGGHKVRGVGITPDLVNRVLGLNSDLSADWFENLYGDRDGNLFIGVEVHTGNMVNYPVWAWFERKTGAMEAAVTMEGLLSIGDDSGFGASSSSLRPTPQGDAWLFVMQNPDNGTHYGKVRRDAGGKWTITDLTDRKAFGKNYVSPDKAFGQGCADWQGGYYFYWNGQIIHLAPDGKASVFLEIDLPPKDDTMSNLVVLENGDIWVAFNMTSGVSQTSFDSSTVYGATDVLTTAYVGGHSFWLRIRPVAGGRPELMFIDGDDILAALKRAGAPTSSILKTHELRVDYKTGGILAWDAFNGALFTLVPEE